MNIKNLIIGFVALAAVVALWLGYINHNKNAIVVNTNTPLAGALAGPDIPSNYLQWGGVYQVHAGFAAAATSSVVCSVQNPLAATSSLNYFGFSTTGNGIGVAQTADLSTSTTAFGTTAPSFIRAVSIASTAYSNVVWTPNGTSSATHIDGVDQVTGATVGVIIGPLEYVNFKIATATPSVFPSYYTGNCAYVFRKM